MLRLGAACTSARNAAHRLVESVVKRSVPACLTLEKYEDHLRKWNKCPYVFHLLTKLRARSRKSLAEILMNQAKFTMVVLPWICRVAQHKTDSDTLELLRGMKLSGVASEALHSPACLDLFFVTLDWCLRNSITKVTHCLGAGQRNSDMMTSTSATVSCEGPWSDMIYISILSFFMVDMQLDQYLWAMHATDTTRNF